MTLISINSHLTDEELLGGAPLGRVAADGGSAFTPPRSPDALRSPAATVAELELRANFLAYINEIIDSLTALAMAHTTVLTSLGRDPKKCPEWNRALAALKANPRGVK